MAQETINLVDVFKVAQEAIKSYNGSERLLNEVTACEEGISRDYESERNRSAEKMAADIERRNGKCIQFIQSMTSCAALRGLLSQENKKNDFATLVMEEEIDSETGLDLLYNFANDMTCTKQELATKLANIIKHARPSEDKATSDPEDILYHQEEEHGALLAQTVTKAIEQHFGLSSVAVSPQAQGWAERS